MSKSSRSVSLALIGSTMLLAGCADRREDDEHNRAGHVHGGAGVYHGGAFRSGARGAGPTTSPARAGVSSRGGFGATGRGGVGA